MNNIDDVINNMFDDKKEVTNNNQSKLRQSVKQVIDNESKSIKLDFNNTFQNNNSVQSNKDNKRIQEAQRTYEEARQIRRDIQETKRVTAEQRTAILKALNSGDVPLREILKMCIECIGTTVNDKAFKRQAIKSYKENY
ncbi:TPA: hypothetical protein ROT39_002982 [Staphylococcus aureus]|nr:hypothetical protein [Staphylococcus epidermidis]MCF7587816.1 hypothetical protein [Staphylococcus epidermidis]MCG1149015.1 hypothetical protein [Staphylococcus epidermidis]HDX8245594.1 hypothetical protein [Staphylococcus aureus]